MQIYLSHNFRMRQILKTSVVPKIEGLRVDKKHTVKSSWLNQPGETTTESTDEYKRFCASQDLDEIQTSDLVIHFAEGEGGRGKFIEVGFALANKIPVFVVGPPNIVETCVFYSLCQRKFATMDELFDCLRNMRDPRDVAICEDARCGHIATDHALSDSVLLTFKKGDCLRHGCKCGGYR